MFQERFDPDTARHFLLESTLDYLAGLDHVHLDASRTAIPFYEAMGYHPDGEPTRGFGVTSCVD